MFWFSGFPNNQAMLGISSSKLNALKYFGNDSSNCTIYLNAALL